MTVGTVLRIVWRDIKRIATTPMALLVLIGISLLPAVYAWYCIAANWDPYHHTSNIHIAVANEDEGASLGSGKTISIGDQLVEKLSQNDQFTWDFVSSDEAQEGVRAGTYYAAFVIPDTLSQEVISVTSGEVGTPKIDYYVNEKYSSTAVKVTDTAATTIERQVDEAFSQTVSQTLITSAQDVAQDAEDSAENAHTRLGSTVQDSLSTLSNAQDALSNVSGAFGEWQNSIASAQDTLAQLSESVPDATNSIDAASRALDTTRQAAKDAQSSVATSALQGTSAIAGVSSNAQLNIATHVNRLMTAKTSVDTALARARVLSSEYRSIATSLDTFVSSLPESSEDANGSLISAEVRKTALDEARKTADALRNNAEALDGRVATLQAASDTLGRKALAVQALSSQANDHIQQGAQSVMKVSSVTLDTMVPTVDSSLDAITQSLGGLSSAVSMVPSEITRVSDLLNQTSGVLSQTGDTLDEVAGALSGAHERLEKTVTDVSAVLHSLEEQELARILGVDAHEVGSFMSMPVQLETQVLYPMEHYASAVAPFYTNLAIWVGCFMLVAIVKMEVDRTGFEKLTAVQAYMVRWLLFVIVSAIQTIVMCVGNVVLGVGIADPVAFLVAGLCTSFAFVNVIYMLGITFKHVGKAMAVLLLIMQIPASSGMYPIEMMPQVFQAFHPLLPFTYGISAMREAIGGMYGQAYAFNLAVLLGIALVSLLIGLFVRPYALNLNVLFDKRIRETTFMLNEDYGMLHPRYRVRNAVRVLLDNEAYRVRAFERVQRFNQWYPRWVRVEKFAIWLIPIAALFVMSQFHVDANGKAIMLLLFVAIVVLIGGIVVIMEYVHDYLTYQMEMSSRSGEELMCDVLEHVPLRHKDFSSDHDINVRDMIARRREREQATLDQRLSEARAAWEASHTSREHEENNEHTAGSDQVDRGEQ